MSRPRVHFSAIGGTAMVAGARLAQEAGWEVRGSDNPLYPPTSHMMHALGVPVATGFDADNLDWNPDVVLIGNVLSRGNPEVEAALERRMNFMSLPEWLKQHVLRARKPIVISGTHGKTTTTALTAHVLQHCNLDPGYLIGGQPLGDGANARLGAEGAPFVIEGDEYDTAFFDKRAKFLHYLPHVSVVTSLEFDHGDIYRDIEEIELAFQRLLRITPPNGAVILCADNAAAKLAAHAYSPVITYGFKEGADWRGELIDSDATQMTVFHRGRLWAEIRLSLYGRHNAQNTLAAISVAAFLGANENDIAAGVASFPGVRRRLEVFHESNGVTFVDDFAHHPTAIRETIAAGRLRWPGRRLRVLFEPRSNTTVTRRFQSDLEDAFSGADEVWLGPIHRADKIAEGERLDRAQLCAALTGRGVKGRFYDDTDALAEKLMTELAPRDVILILSNGAFGGIYEKLKQA